MQATQNDADELEKLVCELDAHIYEARLVTPQGRRPYLHVSNRHAGVLKENVYAGDGFYWWGWAERIAPISDAASAAQMIMQVLRALDTR